MFHDILSLSIYVGLVAIDLSFHSNIIFSPKLAHCNICVKLWIQFDTIYLFKLVSDLVHASYINFFYHA